MPLRVAGAERLTVPTQRLSFFELLVATKQLWGTFQTLGRLITVPQQRHAWEHHLQIARHTAVLPMRRARACPRVLRQPASKWPRRSIIPPMPERSCSS